MIMGNECLDRGATFADRERWSMTGVTAGVVGPTEDDIAERGERRLEAFRRPGFAGTAREDRVADDDILMVLAWRKQIISAV